LLKFQGRAILATLAEAAVTHILAAAVTLDILVEADFLVMEAAISLAAVVIVHVDGKKSLCDIST
jgi:hypothetical protein